MESILSSRGYKKLRLADWSKLYSFVVSFSVSNLDVVRELACSNFNDEIKDQYYSYDDRLIKYK